MILRLSQKLNAKIKAGKLSEAPLDENPYADWSCHLFTADRTQYIMGTEGYIEIRKYIDLTREGSDKIYLVDQKEEKEIECFNKVGFPYFGKLVLDVLNRTDTAMTQEHCFKAAELSLIAQKVADEARS